MNEGEINFEAHIELLLKEQEKVTKLAVFIEINKLFRDLKPLPEEEYIVNIVRTSINSILGEQG